MARAQARAGAAFAAPTVTITSSPASPTTSTKATFAFVAKEASKVKCSLDGADFVSCTSPVTYTGLAIGGHSFVVKAIRDSLSATASAGWQIVASGQPPPTGFSVASSITDGATLAGALVWDARPSRPVGKVDFSIDGTLRWTENIAPYVFNGDGNVLDTRTLTDGSHVLKLVATATDGTRAELSATVRVANGAPPPPPPAGFTVGSSISNGATLAGALVWDARPSVPVSKVEFYIDGALRWTESFAPYLFNGDGNVLDTRTLSDGSHVLKLVATATDGTRAELSATVQVANGAPPPPPPSTVSAGHVQFMVRTNDSMLGFIDNSTAAQQQWMRDHWQRAVVDGQGYWDSKLSWYPNAWAYRNSYAIYKNSSLATQHPDWILRDANQNKLYIPWGCSGGSCPQYAADIGNPAWRQYYIDGCKALIAKGYKGIFADDVDMDINVGNGSGERVVPIDPRTGAPMSDAAWKSYFATFMEQLRAAIPTAEITHNAVWFTGGGQHDGTQPEIVRQIKAADYYNMERGFNDSGLTGGTGVWSVFAVMRFIDNVHAYGRHVILQSYANDPASAEYNLAGYFLISDGRDYVSTTIGSLPSNWWSGYGTDLGDATSGRYLWNGVWRRDFTRGFVLLNEPGASTKTLALGGAFKNTTGTFVSSVTLGAARGAVLSS